MSVITAIGAVILDHWLGETRQFHPLAGFGTLANRVENYFNYEGQGDRAAGLLALSLLVLPLVYITWLLSDGLGPLFDLALLYLSLGGQSLAEHGRAVQVALEADDLVTARGRVGEIVSRDTADMEERDVIRATIESILENGNDAIFGALFWFFIAGAPGVVLYRLANTLDAMWGYRNGRFQLFGEATAKLDDLLNWVPARLTAWAYCAVGRWPEGRHCWRTQAHLLSSPNGGPVMTAGAGSLGVELGGPASYHGEVQKKPYFGTHRLPEVSDIHRALDMVHKSLFLWLTAAVIWGVLFA
ncbi:MAG: adenosylcobinamide-phosphate synthase CbiB [Sedimenticola sp.]